MPIYLVDSLPPFSRLALAYARASSGGDWLTALSLDCRLATIVQQAREPVLAQLRLAWWRDRLSQAIEERPRGEQLLAELAHWQDGGRSLSPLVDGWEAMLSEPPFTADLALAFAFGRAALMGELATRLRCNRAEAEARAMRWALADLLHHLSDPAEQAIVGAVLDEYPAIAARCARAMRPLAVLEAMAMAAGNGRKSRSPLVLLTAMRIGLIGR